MRSIHNHLRPISLVFFLLFAAAGASAQDPRVTGDIADSFRKFDVVRIDTSAAKGPGTSRSIFIQAAGREFDLVISPHDMRAGRYRAEDTSAKGETVLGHEGVNTYKGTVSGDVASEVRLTIDGPRIEGYFTSAGERFFIEPAANYSRSAAADEFVVYREEDAIRNNTFLCGSELAEKITYGKMLAESGRIESVLAARRIELATEADFEYVTTLGSPQSANNEILGILNMAEGVYSTELGLSISVVFQHTWSTADSFAGANSQATVVNFQNYWNANFPLSAEPRDTAHLFSGKANVLSGGWAYIGVICRTPGAAYGMSGYVDWAPAKFLITAHEIGHNLGANHVDATQNCADTLMNAQLSGSTALSFCQYSRDEIATYVAANGVCITANSTCQFDFDGDSKADPSIFRPAPGEWWFLKSSTGQNFATQFGASSDKIVPADFTGDGTADIAFWRPSTGFWYVLRSEDSSFYSFPFGTNGDIPVSADYDGDSKADAAVFRPSTATWFINNSGGGITIQQFGAAGDVPVVADYDGDGKDDIALYRVSAGEWWIQRSRAGLIALQFGNSTDKPVQGDYTGDGKADVAFWRPSTGFWFILRSEDSSFFSFPFGATGDVPAPGDYDGDGKTDATVFRPSNSIWFANRSTAGVLIQQFGITGDLPVPNAFVR